LYQKTYTIYNHNNCIHFFSPKPSVCKIQSAQIARENYLRNNLLSTTTLLPTSLGNFYPSKRFASRCASFVRKRGDTQRATTSGIERRIIVSNNPGRRFSSVPMATLNRSPPRRLAIETVLRRAAGRKGIPLPLPRTSFDRGVMVGKEA